MKTRKATMKDWSEIRRVLQSTRKFSKGDLKDVKDIIATGNGGSFVLINKNEIIGTGSGHWHEIKEGREANVEQIAVMRQSQGKGLGHKLLKRIIKFFRSRGNKKVYARWTKVDVVQFYTKFGFRIVGKSKRTVDLVYKVRQS